MGSLITSVEAVLEKHRVYLGHGTDNYWDEAVHLVCYVLDLPIDSDPSVMGDEVENTEEMVSELNRCLHYRVEECVPLPYITRTAWFAAMPFYIDERALIPRSPIAELLVKQFQPWLTVYPDNILDLCCGGGCIGIAAAHYFQDSKVDMVDISEDALDVARENIGIYALENRVEVFNSNLFDQLPDKKYQLIISNPPYVDEGDMSSLPAEFEHEPVLALAAGVDGLDIVREILDKADRFLTDDGILVVEVGNSQPALEEAFSHLPFVWLEFEHGGSGVFLLKATDLKQ
ncbi:MAG: 50S ribosomal protein L3 N(5)-glutamine methyltransferase [Pseudomonadales bacterium]|nr:50S ribosomal protein L3 N(5)-glutamine methyltransferase [Pseudomonadales bacterium]